jgi:hypothetical protein
MVVTESSHWDPDWLLTSRQYFRWCVRRTLDRAIEALLLEPRRVFSVECAFFPAMYWERRPEQQAVFRELVNEGRLRFTGSGVTTPDTLLPEEECLLRDLLIGQEWLRSRGMTQEPRVLYLPDSFGHSPGTPSLLAAAGIPYAAICRIDGMRFPAAEWEPASNFPRPGTSAALLTAGRTADFIWRGSDGSEVLTHWHAYGYGHGDLIASGGLSRALGLPTAWPDRRAHRVAARVETYIEQLSRLARTPYLLLAIGFDFVNPVPRLVELLDRWNERGYRRTGVWLVNAGLDDYLDLVAHHRAALPTLCLDPNPYWMGFYASRPGLKRACRDLGRHLVAADNERARMAIDAAGSTDAPPPVPEAACAAAWWTAATSNHHDFITGTAPDRVANGEQWPWLRTALANTPRVGSCRGHSSAGAANDRDATAPDDGESERRASWRREGPIVTVATKWLTAVFDEQRGGALVSLIDASGNEHLAAPSLGLVSYAESGGLWRMGNEFRGGRWAMADRSIDHPARITVTACEGAVRLAIAGALDGRSTEVSVELAAHGPSIVVTTAVTAPNRRTVTLSIHQSCPVSSLVMHQPGGMVTRPLQRWYTPTFWPLHSFSTAVCDRNGSPAGGLVLATAVPTALHATAAGGVEIVVARTATKEVAFGFVPVLAPARGHERGPQIAHVALQWLDDTDPAAAIAAGRALCARADHAAGRREPRWLVQTDDPLVEVVAVKPANRGDGIVVRLRNWSAGGARRTIALSLTDTRCAELSAAWRTDSNERDLGALPIRDGAVRLEVGRYLTTIRLQGLVPRPQLLPSPPGRGPESSGR